VRVNLILLLASSALLVAGAAADEGSKPSPNFIGPPVSARGPRPERIPLAERERVAMIFVGEHHPELAALLEPLKAMKPKEYERAINELFNVSRSLNTLKTNDPRRYERALEVWKAKSKAELLAAKWASTPSPELDSQLRSALEHQLDMELRQHELEQTLLKARLKKVEAAMDRLKNKRDTVIESRLKALRNKVQRERKSDAAGKAPSVTPAPAKGDRKA
jgi:hypothetical protein